MTGCAGYGSHTTATISSEAGYAYLYGDDDPWRYHENDWIYYYPGCCADRDELQERLQDWWQAQDPARQQAIKDHVGYWNERYFAANVPVLQQQLDRRWHSMSAKQQMNARQRWQARPVSKHTPNSVLRECARSCIAVTTNAIIRPISAKTSRSYDAPSNTFGCGACTKTGTTDVGTTRTLALIR
ncbi:hypothetical protein [Plesiomonas shigelloides]|uniref:hypothetical protein n=1 Tax=Plesiomonas shigelloides TaxID=703 RepID=UPI001261488E|nr:hypothetical protein [Plesiomonas shigelloides]KAB7667081.1 hypothetical protein GBN18_10980 [Plesiomonas shigelloides]